MEGDRYFFKDQQAIYILTFTIVDWIDIFTRKDYKYIITDSLNYCIKEKGLECFAWVLMSNHLHLVVRTNPPFLISDFMRDFKKFTSKKIVKTIQDIAESRQEWILQKLHFEAKKNGRAENYKLWQDSNHAIDLEGRKDWFLQRIEYTHQNPVRQMIVFNASDYLFSSAGDYEGRKGLVEVSIER